MMKKTIALFDLDKTLIPGDSDHGWGAFLAKHGFVDAVGFKNKHDYFYTQYCAGTLDIIEYSEFAFEVLTRHPMAQLLQWREQFMAEYIEPMIRPQAIALVKKHQDAGHECVLVSATNEFVIEPIGWRLGFEQIIGTKPEQKDGQFTGKVLGTPSFQAGKITRVTQWLNERGADWDSVTTFFYSDSMNDVPLLEKATFPIVANPDETLRGIALARHWPILTLFDMQ